jgi:hypothetical protein
VPLRAVLPHVLRIIVVLLRAVLPQDSSPHVE